MNHEMIQPIHVGAVPLGFALTRLSNLQETIDRVINWRKDNTKVSPGWLVETLAVAIMMGQIPLIQVEAFWKKQDWEQLFRGTGITPEQLNDDAYGRVLDKLADVDLDQLCMEISYQLLKQQDCKIDVIHADTTSRSVQGAFEDQDDPEFEITYGYSKDHRPDLKQIKIGLGVQQDGLPVFGDVFSGNVSDRTWSLDAVQKMKHFFATKGENVPFVLDSSLVSKLNLADMEKQDISFLSLLPDTFKLNESAKLEAFARDNWRDVTVPSGKMYRVYETSNTLDDKEKTVYPLIVVYSEELSKTKSQTLAKKWGKMKKALQKELEKNEKTEYSCEADARTALEASIRFVYGKGFSVKGSVIPVTRQHHPGRRRPKKDEILEETTTYRLSFDALDVHSAFAKREQQLASCFVLISSPTLGSKTVEERLKLYKQQIRVETRFRLLKNPTLFHNVYLKNSRRVKSLGYIFYIVLLHLSYLEYRVRRSLEEQDTYWVGHGKKKTKTPSVKTIVEEAEGLLIMAIGDERHIARPPIPQMHQVIEWAGFDLGILISPILEMKHYVKE